MKVCSSPPGLTSLLHLRLDNTVVTDIGMKYIAGRSMLIRSMFSRLW